MLRPATAWAYVALAGLLTFCCAKYARPKLPNDSSLRSARTNSDRSQDYYLRNGVSCHKTADYTKASKTAGALAIKNIFNATGSFESKWENARPMSPKFEELEAVFFDICYEYGQGLLTKE